MNIRTTSSIGRNDQMSKVNLQDEGKGVLMVEVTRINLGHNILFVLRAEHELINKVSWLVLFLAVLRQTFLSFKICALQRTIEYEHCNSNQFSRWLRYLLLYESFILIKYKYICALIVVNLKLRNTYQVRVSWKLPLWWTSQKSVKHYEGFYRYSMTYGVEVQ